MNVVDISRSKAISPISNQDIVRRGRKSTPDPRRVRLRWTAPRPASSWGVMQQLHDIQDSESRGGVNTEARIDYSAASKHSCGIELCRQHAHLVPMAVAHVADLRRLHLNMARMMHAA
ncbi:hypothetical protein MRB53_037071 [Persea americana]|nr:hypothetical protein MRB53_037071 [Persea americana]